MISSASTLLLATLVFNAATVLGAPIRIVDTSSEPVARAEMSTPVQPVVARGAIVDVEDNRRRSQLGHITRRLVRLSERDEPLSEAVVAREPEPVVEPRERRYPRRVYHNFYTREPEPAVPVVAPVVESRERRYPRQVYHDFYVKREPATSIKETKTVVEKITVLDTPADVAAFKAANPPSASPSISGVSASVSTITSTSQTTTILASGSTPTPAPTSTSGDSSSASASASSSASDATSTSASPTSTTASGEPTSTASDAASTSASATSTAASGEPTPTASGDSSATSTSSAASGQPTDAPADGKSGDPKPAVTVDGTTSSDPAAGSSDPTAREDTGGDITEARRGIYIKASTAPIVRRLATSGASWASSVRRRQLNTH